MEKLLLIAGPTGAGKTTLARSLETGAATHVTAAVGLGAEPWMHRPFWRLVGRRVPDTPRLAVQYDILRPWKRGDGFAVDPTGCLDALAAASDDIQILSLRAHPEVLLERLRSRAPDRLRALLASKGLSHAVGKRRDFRRLEALYGADVAELDALVERWLAYAESLAAGGHWLVESGDPRCLLRRTNGRNLA